MPIWTIWHWVIFIAFILCVIIADLLIFHRRAHVMRMREASIWACICISLALIFNLGILIFVNVEYAGMFLTAYLVEETLSVDNLFVFMVIFSYFHVPLAAQPIVLFWGIIGAIVMRILFILSGIELLKAFDWMIYVFGGLLILTGLKLLFSKDEAPHPERNPLIGLFKKIFPSTHEYHERKFFVRIDGRLLATPLLLVVFVVETTDVMFAIDSVPAVLAITNDPFIAFTSNIFAVLGLRALFFVISGFLHKLKYLKFSLALVLAFIGIKMVTSHHVKMHIGITLGVVGGLIGGAIIASLLIKEDRSNEKTEILPKLGGNPPDGGTDQNKSNLENSH